jgi:hypothetical protein
VLPQFTSVSAINPALFSHSSYLLTVLKLWDCIVHCVWFGLFIFSMIAQFISRVKVPSQVLMVSSIQRCTAAIVHSVSGCLYGGLLSDYLVRYSNR